MKNKNKKQKQRNFRAWLIVSFFMLWLVLVGTRAGYLQIYRGAWLSHKAAGQYEKALTIQGKRGAIYDRRHQPMAVSIETTSVAAYPALVSDPSQTAKSLANALNLGPGEVRRKLATQRSFVWIKRQATPKEAAAVKDLNLKGIEFLPEHSRFYPNTHLAAQVLGFTGIDGHGLEGLEFYYDQDIKGEERTVRVLKDALGRGFDAEGGLGQAGDNLILTIDGNVQNIAEQALAEAVIQFKAQSGMAVVMKPQTGEILAMAHYPFFNPNAFGRYSRTHWRNRAITDPFEPGSTMKIFSAAAALESETSTAHSIYYCENGAYSVAGHTIHDTKSHGWLSLQQIVKYSSNIGVVKVIEQVGAQTLYEYLKHFGFGGRTHIDCPGETSGSLTHYRRWSVVDTSAIAFGQGVAVSALQLMNAASALANDGLMMRPYIVKAITGPNGRLKRKVEPVVVRRVISADTAQTLRRIMRTVMTTGGTGANVDLPGYSVCGKTGTAQKIDKNGNYSRERYVSSFIGFAPVERPELAVLVVVDEPKGVSYGGMVAGPAFRKIVKESLGYLNVPPSQDMQKLRVSKDMELSLNSVRP